MSKTLELHNYLLKMVDSNDERLVVKDENSGVEFGLFDHAFSLSCDAKSELEKLQQDLEFMVDMSRYDAVSRGQYERIEALRVKYNKPTLGKHK